MATSRIISRVVMIVSSALVIGGLVFLLAPEYQAWSLRQQGETANTAQLIDAKQQAKPLSAPPFEIPTKLQLPRLGIAVNLQKANYSPQTAWSLDDSHAFYTLETATPLFYGHATEKVFLKLTGVAENELLYITNNKQQRLIFRFISDRVVAPTNTKILNEKKYRTIFLLTCTGPDFSQRRVLEFQFVGLEEPSGS
ncbi:MAG TPA: sortase [Verrucomicrobiae bacterium]|nr:sortase [Verrucomicrobiae bacterium]